MRRVESNLDYMQYLGLTMRWAQKSHNLKRADLELLFYLYPFTYFTIQQFKDGETLYCWDNDRFYRLQREGWITKVHAGHKRGGERDKYKVSQTGTRLLRRMDRIMEGKEDLPETTLKTTSYTTKVINSRIKIKNHKKWDTYQQPD